MANRVLRDWTGSKKINKVSPFAERFFTRLIMKVDDFGCYPADPVFLKSTLFPLIEDLSSKDVEKWACECDNIGLIKVYRVNDEDYLQIVDFKQRLRQARGKYPLPIDGQTSDNGRPETKRNETESETETETNPMDEVVELSLEASKVALDLTSNLCKFFSVKTDVMSPVYDTVCDYAECLSNQNKIESAKQAFAEYSIYKARSQEKIHNISSWIGTKEKHYQDGQWATIDWSSKNKNYNGITSNKGISGQGGPEAGKDYKSGGGF